MNESPCAHLFKFLYELQTLLLTGGIRLFGLLQFGIISEQMNLERQLAGLFGLGISPIASFYLHRTIQTQKQSMPLVGFEPKIPVFERAKTNRTDNDVSPLFSFSPSKFSVI
jgi:hypothetical protein